MMEIWQFNMFPLKRYNHKIPTPYQDPGGFGTKRKYDVHTGVDLYCEDGDDVYSIEDGVVNSHSAELGAAGGRLAVALVKGMVNGITAGISEVTTAITNLASKAVQAAKDALGIHSPSRKFRELGIYSGQGLVNGLLAMKSAVGSASTELGEEATSGFDNSNPGNLFGFDDSNPKITPVVDLSEVKKGASDIAKIFGDQPNITTVSARQASKISESRALDSSTVGSGSQTSVSNNINYTQNNYSPKALSRLEIYRNTRNQLQTLKGVS